MAVIDTFYKNNAPTYPSALVATLTGFLDERASMNKALLAEQLRASAPGDDAKLLQMEADLRDRSAKLAAAKAAALAGNAKAAKEMVSDLIGNATKLEIESIRQAATSSRTNRHETAETRRANQEAAMKEAGARAYDTGLQRRVASAGEEYADGSVDDQSMDALDVYVNGIVREAHADEPGWENEVRRASIQHDLIKSLRANGDDAKADAYAARVFGTEDEDDALSQMTGVRSEEQIDADNRKDRAHGGGGGAFAKSLISGAMDQIAGGSTPVATSTSERTSTRGGDGGGDGSPGMGLSGVRMKGNAPLGQMGALAAALEANDPAAIAKAFDDAQAALAEQDARIEAARAKKTSGPRVGANYLLDNPYTYVEVPKHRSAASASPALRDQVFTPVDEPDEYHGGRDRAEFVRDAKMMNDAVTEWEGAGLSPIEVTPLPAASPDSAETFASGVAKKREVLKQKIIEKTTEDAPAGWLDAQLKRVESMPPDVVDRLYGAAGGE